MGVQKIMMVNGVPHHLLNFTSEGNIWCIAEKDPEIIHPLGEVFMSKGTNIDNDIRFVVLKPINDSPSLQAFLFNVSKWNHKKNPFNPEYNLSFSQTMKVLFRKFSETIYKAKRIIVQPEKRTFEHKNVNNFS